MRSHQENCGIHHTICADPALCMSNAERDEAREGLVRSKLSIAEVEIAELREELARIRADWKAEALGRETNLVQRDEARAERDRLAKQASVVRDQLSAATARAEEMAGGSRWVAIRMVIVVPL